MAGRWRPTEAEAIEDAVRVGLAHRFDGELVWRVPTRIEMEDDQGEFPIWIEPGPPGRG